jgi:PAS domain S-box-containing protein
MTAQSNRTSNANTIVVNNVPIEWNEGGRGFKFFGLDSIIFWKSPSLISILHPLRRELGDELYSLIVAFEASKGTFEDYHSMMGGAKEGNFEKGFLNWGNAVSGAGWGSFSFLSLDFDAKEAVIRIDDPWEMKIFEAENRQDAVPFLSGKISGIFSHAFRRNCRSEVLEACRDPSGHNFAVIRVRPSNETLEQALFALHSRQDRSPQEQLRAANGALRKNEQRLVDVLGTIGERIWETDAHYVVRHLSDLLQTPMKLATQRILGKSLLSIIHPDDQEMFREACASLVSGQTNLAEMRIRLCIPEHETIWVHFRFKALRDHSGQHEGFLGSARDITSKVLLEKQIAQERERAAQAAKMASLGEMAAGIAHEINNPLAEIIANAWHVRTLHENNKLNGDTLGEALSAIESTSKRIAEIIKGMRAFSRESGGEPFAQSEIASIIDETLVFCRTRFKNHGVDLRLPEVVPMVKIECRAIQISQVLLNLLNNAFDAVEGRPEKWIQIGVEDRGSVIQVHVTDSGAGVPKEVVGKLMQPFFTTKGPGKGTGLGLSVSRGIIESHGGRLFLDEQSQQTRFVIELPKRQP